jgi:hypothetical protein
MLDRRAQIDQERTGPEDPPGFLKGMNHALTWDSSEGPSEYHHIEGFIGEGKPASIGNDMPCPLTWGFWRLGRGGAYELSVWISGRNRCAQPCQTAGKPAASTSDLQGISTGPHGRCAKCANLVLFRINVVGHE